MLSVKKLLLLVIMLLVAYKSYSQFYIGGRVGANFSTITYDNKNIQSSFKNDRKLQQGVNAGLSILFSQNEVLFFNADIFFSQKGMKVSQYSSDGQNRYGYLQVESLGRYAANLKKNNYLTFGIGPYFSFWATGNYVTIDNATGLKTKSKIEFETLDFKYNRFDGGIVFAIGYLFKNDCKAWGMDIKYEVGMVSNAGENVDGSKNRVLSVNLYYLFKFGK